MVGASSHTVSHENNNAKKFGMTLKHRSLLHASRSRGLVASSTASSVLVWLCGSLTQYIAVVHVVRVWRAAKLDFMLVREDIKSLCGGQPNSASVSRHKAAPRKPVSCSPR